MAEDPEDQDVELAQALMAAMGEASVECALELMAERDLPGIPPHVLCSALLSNLVGFLEARCPADYQLQLLDQAIAVLQGERQKRLT